MKGLTDKLGQFQGLIAVILTLLATLGVEKADLLVVLRNPLDWGIREPLFLVAMVLIIGVAIVRQTNASASRLKDPNCQAWIRHDCGSAARPPHFDQPRQQRAIIRPQNRAEASGTRGNAQLRAELAPSASCLGRSPQPQIAARRVAIARRRSGRGHSMPIATTAGGAV